MSITRKWAGSGLPRTGPHTKTYEGSSRRAALGAVSGPPTLIHGGDSADHFCPLVKSVFKLGSDVPPMVCPTIPRAKIECRLSIRESTFFRGAKGDYIADALGTPP